MQWDRRKKDVARRSKIARKYTCSVLEQYRKHCLGTMASDCSERATAERVVVFPTVPPGCRIFPSERRHRKNPQAHRWLAARYAWCGGIVVRIFASRGRPQRNWQSLRGFLPSYPLGEDADSPTLAAGSCRASCHLSTSSASGSCERLSAARKFAKHPCSHAHSAWNFAAGSILTTEGNGTIQW